MIDGLLAHDRVRAARAHIERSDEATLARQASLSAIPAPTGAERARACRVAEMFADAGLEAVELDEVGNVRAWLGKRETGNDCVAVAAHLLRSTLPESLDADLGDFATSFYRETGERIRVTGEDPRFADGIVFDLQGEERILSVVVDRPDPVVRAQELMNGWVTRIVVLLLVAWIALAIGARARTEGRDEREEQNSKGGSESGRVRLHVVGVLSDESRSVGRAGA